MTLTNPPGLPIEKKAIFHLCKSGTCASRVPEVNFKGAKVKGCPVTELTVSKGIRRIQ